MLESDDVGAFLGYSVAGAGDVDGDGYDDVIVGAPNYGPATGARRSSFTEALPGPERKPIDRGDELRFPGTNAVLGWWSPGAGDVNGDGYGTWRSGHRA